MSATASGLPKRVLVAGAGGMLGTAVQRVAPELGWEVIAPAEGAFDITDAEVVAAAVRGFAAAGPGLLLNAAAYTNVERAEDEPERAYAVNEDGARILAHAARDAGLGFVHVSTDFVFDGTGDRPYREDDPVNPLSVYGASKLAGERAVAQAYPDALTVRTAWVYGPAGVNFPSKILEAAQSRPSLSVVTDEVGSPTYTVELARGILRLAEADAAGLYHLTGSGTCSRFELAAEVLRLAGIDTPIEPVESSAFPTKAARPSYSVLDCSKAAALGVTLPDWRASLADFVAEWKDPEGV